MPAILAAVLIFIGIIFAVAWLIPMLVTALLTTAIGAKAKFSADDKLELCFKFYQIMTGVYFFTILLGNTTGGFWGLILSAIFSIFWPVFMFIMTYNWFTTVNDIGIVSYEHADKNAAMVWTLYAIGIALTFAYAIYKIRKRTASALTK